jgi:hypothetical protein
MCIKRRRDHPQFRGLCGTSDEQGHLTSRSVAGQGGAGQKAIGVPTGASVPVQRTIARLGPARSVASDSVYAGRAVRELKELMALPIRRYWVGEDPTILRNVLSKWDRSLNPTAYATSVTLR